MSYASTLAATPGVIAAWTLDETSGTFADSIGTHVGTAAGTVTRGQTPLVQDGGFSVAFATGSKITTPAHADWNFGTGAFWLCGWFKTGVTGLRVVAGWSYAPTGTIWFGPNVAGLPIVQMGGPGSGNSNQTIGTTSITDGNRHFFCLTRAAGGAFALYLDGSLSAELTGTYATAIDASGYAFGIGAMGNDGTYPFTSGTIDSIAIGKGSSLTATQAKALYDAGIATGGALAAGTLSESSHTSSSATLSWTAGSGGTAPITAQLKRSASGANTYSNVSGATTSPATDTGLSPSTAYDYRVTFTDAASGTVNSNVVTVTTDAAATPAVTMTSPVAYKLHQRDSSNLADIPVIGTYAGTPAAIEAGFGGFATIVPSPSGNAFSSKVSRRSAGSGSLTARFADSTSVATTIATVMVGDLFVVSGQSNSVGYSTIAQPYSPSNLIPGAVYNRAGSWAALADPVDSTGTGGSIWPRLAAKIVQRTGVPIGLVPCGVAGTAISTWLPGQTNYANMITRARSASGSTGAGGIKAAFWWQGETDAINATSRATYAASLKSVADGVWTDLGCPLIVFQLQTCVGSSGNITAPALAAIRAAQADAIRDHPHIINGGDFVSLTTDDPYHLQSNANLAAAATIAEAAYFAAFPEPTGGSVMGIRRLGFNGGF